MATWNRSENWEVHVSFHERAHLYVSIDPTKRAADLAALRRFIPSLRDVSPFNIRKLIDKSNRIDLGEMSGRAARKLSNDLSLAGLENERIDTSMTGYLPVNKTHGSAWIIEDSSEAEQIAKEMIAAGFPIIQIEA